MKSGEVGGRSMYYRKTTKNSLLKVRILETLKDIRSYNESL